MELCEDFRISYSQLLGGTPGVWTDDDVEIQLAFRSYKRARCSDCGSKLDGSDWFDLRSGELLDPPLLEPVSTGCYGCEECSRLDGALRSKDGRLPAGRHVGLGTYNPDRDPIRPTRPEPLFDPELLLAIDELVEVREDE